jgi:hypothetical protein
LSTKQDKLIVGVFFLGGGGEFLQKQDKLIVVFGGNFLHNLRMKINQIVFGAEMEFGKIDPWAPDPADEELPAPDPGPAPKDIKGSFREKIFFMAAGTRCNRSEQECQM